MGVPSFLTPSVDIEYGEVSTLREAAVELRTGQLDFGSSRCLLTE